MPDIYGNARTFGPRGRARKEGSAAYKAGMQRINPYDRMTDNAQYLAWDAGYRSARNLDEAVRKVK